MGITEIALYNLLRKKMGEEETYELMQFIHSEVKGELDTKTNVFLIKEDKIELIQNANAVKIELMEQAKADKIELMQNAKTDKIELIQQAKADKIELIDRMNVNKIDLIDRMNKNKSETLVWIVGVGVLQFVLAFLTKMLR
jgi:hypothetical protein